MMYTQSRTSRESGFVFRLFFVCVYLFFMFATSISCQICGSSMSIENKLCQSSIYISRWWKGGGRFTNTNRIRKLQLFGVFLDTYIELWWAAFVSSHSVFLSPKNDQLCVYCFHPNALYNTFIYWWRASIYRNWGLHRIDKSTLDIYLKHEDTHFDMWFTRQYG